MEVSLIQRVLLGTIGLGGSFALVVMIALNHAAQHESDLRDFISTNKRLLEHCYKYTDEGTPKLITVEGYRAQCVLDYDGSFVIEDHLEITASILKQE